MTLPRWAGREHTCGVSTFRILWARVLTAGALGFALGIGLQGGPIAPPSQASTAVLSNKGVEVLEATPIRELVPDLPKDPKFLEKVPGLY